MKIVNWLRKCLFTLAGLLFVFPKTVIAEEKPHPRENLNAPPKQEKAVPAEFTREQLIRSLQDMNRSPEQVNVVCAMCYEMVVPANEVEFQCPKCQKKTTHLYDTPQGALTQESPYIIRSLKTVPYKITVDCTGLCSYCEKGRDKALVMRVSCFACGKDFSWNVKDRKDIDMLHWLYMRPPFKEIDGHYLGFWSSAKPDDRKKIKEGAAYILEHVFCLGCRSKVKLED